MLIFTTDKPRLQQHFEKDKVLFSYHLGDLDDFYFPYCQWGVDYKDRARIEEAILIYTGCEIPSVIAFGLSERFEGLLEQMLPLLPPKFFCHFQEQSRSLFQSSYKEDSLGTHHKMKLNRLQPVIKSAYNSSIIRLDESHLAPLETLYTSAYPGNYFTERMLLTGKYFGYIEDEKILSVSGVHVDSDKYKIAVLGNIVTDIEHRGKGLGTAVTSKLVEELVAEDKMVCLNVKEDNVPAIASYTKLGFEKTHEYEEAAFRLI